MLLNRIRKVCKARNIKIDKMAVELGMGEKSLYAWDRQNPSVNKVKAVADYLGVSVDYLLQPEYSEQLQSLLDANHMDLVDMCQYLDISAKDGLEFLSGSKIPDEETTQRIADYFDVDPEFLTGKKPEQKSEGISYSDLTPGEQRVVEYYRELSPENKKKAELMLHVLGVE